MTAALQRSLRQHRLPHTSTSSQPISALKKKGMADVQYDEIGKVVAAVDQKITGG
jgi:hypothetical protein